MNIFHFYLGGEMSWQFDWFDIVLLLLLSMGIKVNGCVSPT